METVTKSPPPQRPQHRRNASSKSNILRSLVLPKSRSSETQSPRMQNSRTQTVPLLPPDHPHAASKSKVLGERQNNARSPPISPSKTRQKSIAVSKTSNDLRTCQSPTKKSVQDASASPKKSRSSTNLTGMFAKMNRSNKDLSAIPPKVKDKENTTPPSSSKGERPAETSIGAELASTSKPTKPGSRPGTRDGINSSVSVQEEIAKYTPTEYSPSKQRNFNGAFDQPQMRPTLSSRPQSCYVLGTDVVGVIGRRMSGDRSSFGGRKSEDLERQKRTSTDTAIGNRKTSGSSTEQAPVEEKLNITKRGGRVMAAVAAFQGKGKDQQAVRKEEAVLDEKAVDEAFETVLDSRNVPEPMRQKMRSLTLRVKADFVKQDQDSSKNAGSSPPGTMCSAEGVKNACTTKAKAETLTVDTKTGEEEDKSTKRSSARSRTFTFSKGDKRGDASPSKKQRSQSKSRSEAPKDRSPTTPTTPRSSMMDKRSSGAPALPADYISYLKKNHEPMRMEIGRLHKLRILLRNETVSWVDTFLSLGGMVEIVALLHRIMAVEWREEHEDQLLHEALLCLKGLCTTERAISELERVADELFPALIAMLFDDEKKGPAEYTTRGVITTVLFNFLSAAPPEGLQRRAEKILTYLGEPTKAETERPVDFVLDMRVPRPYKLWCREVSNVTREVFWIFLHHLNVVPLPRPSTSDSDTTATSADPAERVKVLEATYTTRHFPPSTRPPVPAAPYIGGVEWDATTYITTHLDLLNGLIASLPTRTARNALRREFRDSGFEKTMGATLRTCKEKFYAGVHDGLRAWVAAASEDGWETLPVREGPTMEEQAQKARASPRKSPVKREKAPQLDVPKLDLALDGGKKGHGDDDDDGWLG